MTDAESLLWRYLRRRQVGGYKFRRQHPLGHDIVDFVCLDARLVVEGDGSQHIAGRENDASRTAWLEQRDYTVLRFWNHDVLQRTGMVLQVICHELEQAFQPPSRPSPCQGEGEDGASHAP